MEKEELLKCMKCGEKFIRVDEHTYRPGCNCFSEDFRVSVGDAK
jgi:Zn finger protein HypA/HybF involved in hydrogenase expression